MSQQGYLKIIASDADVRFPSFLQGFNQRWFSGNCQAVYLCFDPAGTAAALDDAIAMYGKNVKIKSGGHCYEDFVYSADTAAIIDVTPMGSYGLDPDRGYYLESGGTNWTAFQALFRDYGKVLPAGSCYSVGLGGHICGGGYGLLSRLNGLTVDWLTGVEVVVKDKANSNAYPVFASADNPDPSVRDLFWAHRGGGGGNFGVITKYYFKTLPDAPKEALLTTVAFPWSDLTPTILGNLLNFLAELAVQPDNWRMFGIFALNHVAAGSIHLTLQTALTINENADEVRETYVKPVMAAISKIATYRLMDKPALTYHGMFYQGAVETLPYTFYEVVQNLNGSGSNQRGKYKSAYMRKQFPQDQVAAIYFWLNNIPQGLSAADMMQSLLQIDTYGGQINIPQPTDTAIYQRSSILKLQYQTYWTDPGQDDAHLNWIRNFYTDVYKSSGGVPDPAQDPTDNVDGCYYNYPDADLNNLQGGREAALKLYFGQNLPRLKLVKGRWDPNNLFNSQQSITI